MQLNQNWPGTNQGRQSASILHQGSYKNPFIYFKDCALPFLSHLHLFLRLFLIFLSPLASRHGWIILFIITTLSQNWRAQPESEGWFRDSSPPCLCRKVLGMWTAPQLPRPLSSKGRAMRGRVRLQQSQRGSTGPQQGTGCTEAEALPGHGVCGKGKAGFSPTYASQCLLGASSLCLPICSGKWYPLLKIWLFLYTYL